MSSHVRVEDRPRPGPPTAMGPARIVTIDRPAAANALTGAMLRALTAAVREAPPDTATLILAGAGAHFSAGADLREVRDAGLALSPAWEALSDAVAAFPALSVAALGGTLAGGAFGMALACDLRIAAPGAALFYPVAARGLLPRPRDPGRLAALVGPARARLLLLGGARPDAEEARLWGLVDRVAPDPLAEALAMGGDAAHLAAIKRMLP